MAVTKKETLIRPKLIRVEWVDPASISRWTEEEDLGNLAERQCQTVGWLVGKSTKGTVMVASSMSVTEQGEDRLWADRTAIPRGCIRRIVVLDAR